MRFVVACNLVMTALVALSTVGCGRQKSDDSEQRQVSYYPREPGSVASPTHETSFQLMAADGPTRLASIQAMIVQAGKPCDRVTRAVFKGGLDGTDQWRIRCADSGDWSMWLSPGRQDIIR